MGTFTGMDIASVRTLGQQLQSRADEIRTLTQQLTGQIESTAWVGPDRDQFHGDWTGQHTAALTTVVTGLENASARALRNADEQEQASSR